MFDLHFKSCDFALLSKFCLKIIDQKSKSMLVQNDLLTYVILIKLWPVHEKMLSMTIEDSYKPEHLRRRDKVSI